MKTRMAATMITPESTTFDLRSFLRDLPPFFSIDVETTGLERDDEIITASISWPFGDKKKISSFPFHLDRFSPGTEKSNRDFKRILDATLFNPAYKGVVIFHNVTFDLPLLLRRYYRTPPHAWRSAPEKVRQILRRTFRKPAHPCSYHFRLKDFCKIYGGCGRCVNALFPELCCRWRFCLRSGRRAGHTCAAMDSLVDHE